MKYPDDMFDCLSDGESLHLAQAVQAQKIPFSSAQPTPKKKSEA